LLLSLALGLLLLLTMVLGLLFLLVLEILQLGVKVLLCQLCLPKLVVMDLESLKLGELLQVK
jgi:hypothetical protein